MQRKQSSQKRGRSGRCDNNRHVTHCNGHMRVCWLSVNLECMKTLAHCSRMSTRQRDDHHTMELFCSGHQISWENTRDWQWSNAQETKETCVLHEYTRETTGTCAFHECTTDTNKNIGQHWQRNLATCVQQIRDKHSTIHSVHTVEVQSKSEERGHVDKHVCSAVMWQTVTCCFVVTVTARDWPARWLSQTDLNGAGTGRASNEQERVYPHVFLSCLLLWVCYVAALIGAVVLAPKLLELPKIDGTTSRWTPRARRFSCWQTRRSLRSLLSLRGPSGRSRKKRKRRKDCNWRIIKKSGARSSEVPLQDPKHSSMCARGHQNHQTQARVSLVFNRASCFSPWAPSRQWRRRRRSGRSGRKLWLRVRPVQRDHERLGRPDMHWLKLNIQVFVEVLVWIDVVLESGGLARHRLIQALRMPREPPLLVRQVDLLSPTMHWPRTQKRSRHTSLLCAHDSADQRYWFQKETHTQKTRIQQLYMKTRGQQHWQSVPARTKPRNSTKSAFASLDDDGDTDVHDYGGMREREIFAGPVHCTDWQNSGWLMCTNISYFRSGPAVNANSCNAFWDSHKNANQLGEGRLRWRHVGLSLCGGRSRQTSPYSLWAECAGCLRTFKWRTKWKRVRQEVREVKSEDNGEVNGEGEPHTSWAHVDGMNDGHKTHDLSQSECAMWRYADTRRTRQGTYTQVIVLMCSVWKDSHGCHVVIGVGRVIVQRHHASITYQYWILTFSPLLYLLSDCMIWSSLLSCSHLLHTFAPRKRFIWGVVFTPPVGYSRPLSAVNDPSVTE